MKKPMTEKEIEMCLKKLLPRNVVITTCEVKKENSTEDGVEFDRTLYLVCYEVGFSKDPIALAKGLKVGISNIELLAVITDFSFYMLKHCRDRLFIPFLDVVENHETVQ